MNLKRTEKTVLNNLLNIIPANKMLLTVYYNCAGIIYSDELLQDEIQAKSEFIKTITKVKAEIYKKPSVTIYNSNARLLIRKVSQYNLLSR
ncbi:hypothetical protein [Tenacibaculum finnmarkense]|uniref:Uncharacterized protein n=1 Tax=Tenacibaculum finnmarkense genomovar finnmarkense TaxID=1458503 RepID=A0AAP1REN7_9FLAO|nr:hypothetical protein [Tenacibaculum finnmarkense]MBE7652316.1 hypothetical protein [Tenacibaculum finnmarkense genomovar finnmarkense]MBE7694512.1 hypothetical protein [Tenacibaculum finnmarkense genomovar finnmarkense]MCD8426699.1 hypothetical protein [Tenacibaculum finnmarkense genomovar finnmarkense]MCG8751014.1 hypothetical protein [Tenacibaculum finnmarkense]MCG8772005.1 hypothetical protein [Tenacibaculum finnmarkense]